MIPMLGFPNERFACGMYSCAPAPNLRVTVTQEGRPGIFNVFAFTNPPGMAVATHWDVDGLLAVVALIHHFVNTYGGNLDC